MQKKDSHNPTIAVVIAAKNASNFIGEALDSIVDQTVLPEEVVVVDDGSDDDTMSVIESYLEELPMLKMVKNPSDSGISKARNIGNEQVSSDYIAVLDADDLFDHNAISNYKDFIRENPKVDLVYADTSVFRRTKCSAVRMSYPEFSSTKEAIRNTLGRPLLPFKHSSMIYRTTAIQKLDGYSEMLEIKVDIELFLRFLSNGMIVRHMPSSTSYHRKHNSQISVSRLTGMPIYIGLIRDYEPVVFFRYLLMCIRIPSEFLKLLVKG